MIKRLLYRISKTRYVRSAIEERADLAALKQKPTRRVIVGLIVIAVSYILGWPAVGAMGILSVTLQEPLVLIIGGPLIYGISHLVFILGMYLAGAEHTKVFFRWATRVSMEKLLGPPLEISPGLETGPPPESRGGY
ncbi:MAG: hypothetical protein V2B19_13570 [Pseudomonadota bacterium]